MKQTITAQVVMLPTEDNTKIFYHRLSGKIGWTEVNLKIRHDRISQHLYFISTDPKEEIKEGDWFAHTELPKLYKDTCYISDNDIECEIHDCYVPKSYARKIIASTDPALGLPAIPLTWIRDVYVPSNGSIKEVRLEL